MKKENKKFRNRKINHLSLETLKLMLEKLKTVRVFVSIPSVGNNKKEKVIVSDQSNSKYAQHIKDRIKVLEV